MIEGPLTKNKAKQKQIQYQRLGQKCRMYKRGKFWFVEAL